MKSIFSLIRATSFCCFIFSSRCCCGLSLNEHAPDVKLEALARLGASGFRALVTGGPNAAGRRIPSTTERWQVKTHTREMSTNAYGTVEFQGGPHPTRARVSKSTKTTACRKKSHDAQVRGTVTFALIAKGFPSFRDIRPSFCRH